MCIDYKNHQKCYQCLVNALLRYNQLDQLQQYLNIGAD